MRGASTRASGSLHDDFALDQGSMVASRVNAIHSLHLDAWPSSSQN
jgi:hypothetical protein